jgi:predicted NBD/HSP70 family sugar kinase
MHKDAADLSLGFGAAEIFNILCDGVGRSRAELVSLTGFARATVTSRVEELLRSGLISSEKEAASTGGRPSVRFVLRPGAKLVVAADFGATHAHVAVMDLAGSRIASTLSPRAIAAGPESSLAWLRETVEELLEHAIRSLEDIVAIGIGLPGPVEHATGRPTNPPIMPGWDGYDVPRDVRTWIDVPVLVDNDVNVMALGEKMIAWPDVDNLLFVKVSTGIGAGIICGGILLRGEDGSAGDIGHIAIPRGGSTVCRCGNTGCLEAVAGVPAILDAVNLARHGKAPVATIYELLELGKKGDIAAMTVVRQAGRDLGEVLSMCVSVLNPSVIVVGGALAQLKDVLIAGIREVVYSRSAPLATHHLTIAATQVGSEAGVIGAGRMALEHALSIENFPAMMAAAMRTSDDGPR